MFSFSIIFNDFVKRERIDNRLTVCEYTEERIKGSLIIRILFSDDVIAERFKKLERGLSDTLRDRIRCRVIGMNREKGFGLVDADGVNVYSSADYTGSVVTQCLLGENVKILQAEGDWLRIMCNDGYIGWINRCQIVLMSKDEIEHWEKNKFYTYYGIIGNIKEKPSISALSLRRISAGCRLPKIKGEGEYIKVRLPDSVEGWIKNECSILYKDGDSIRERIVKTSKVFLGIPYIWGGKTPAGFDCSGFVQTVFRLNGILLPRDSDMQYVYAEGISGNMKKGDLLFFGKNKVTHVGIYLGRDKFIHSQGYVKINSFRKEDRFYDKKLKECFIESKSVF
ncbi:C40 family peptidase [bacterium]|nr:C40 family peptidase [bacterium]